MRSFLRQHGIEMVWLAAIIVALFLLGGCGGTRAANPEAAIEGHSDAIFREALAQEKKAHAKTQVERDDAENKAEVARAERKAAEDKIVQENHQRVIDQQVADQQSDHRWARTAIVASCVLAALTLRFPALSGLLLTLATATSAAAYGFAAAGWLRGHLWLVPSSGVALGLVALIHHLTGKDHQVRTGALAGAARATLTRWLPNLAHLKAAWHLPPWLTAIGNLFHRHSTPAPTPSAPPGATP